MPEEHFIRTVTDLDVKKIPAPMDPIHYELYDLFDFYEFSVTSRSFYRSQVSTYT